MDLSKFEKNKTKTVLGILGLSFIAVILIVTVIIINWRIMVIIGLLGLMIGILFYFRDTFRKYRYFIKHEEIYPNKEEINQIISKYRSLVILIVLEAIINPIVFYFAFRWSLTFESWADPQIITFLGELTSYVGYVIATIAIIPYFVGTLVYKYILWKNPTRSEDKVNLQLSKLTNEGT